MSGRKKPICVYFLQDGRKSYIGYTTDLQQRFRRHKSEIKGGAKYTKTWNDHKLIAFIAGFPDKTSALSYEFHAQQDKCVARVQFKDYKVKPHPTFCKFLEPLFSAQFMHVRDDLVVVLCDHHEYGKEIMEKYPIRGVILGRDDVHFGKFLSNDINNDNLLK